ncbi:ROK family protein [Rouxiella badensis]|uniref:ROK family protein n=1 Tax=Rouxiella badensis TaxID=1646377 RepID=UPI0022AA077C|nr:ROK family protein [Rouxiella badensis]WAT09740.1 ROK family protein [Rouxiella badensis]
MMVNTGTAVFCADIGGSFIKFGLSRQQGEVTVLAKVATPTQSWDEFVLAMQMLLNEHGAEVAADAPLAISTAGLVSPQSGEVMATNIPSFTGHNLAAELTQILKRKVSVANDADCFALAEAHVGEGQGLPIVVGIILGTGVGGGLVFNGQLVRGHGGVTGEWGHGAITRTELLLDNKLVRVPRLLCGCGQSGCLDMLGGARGIERLHFELHQQTLTSHQIIEGWQAGSFQAVQTLNAWLALVSEPLTLMVNILGATRVVVGGGLASVIPLIAALDQRVRESTLHKYPQPLVVPGKFVNQGGLVGASVLGRQR